MSKSDLMFVDMSNKAVAAQIVDEREIQQARLDGLRAYYKGLQHRQYRCKAYKWDKAVTAFACVCGLAGTCVGFMLTILLALVF